MSRFPELFEEAIESVVGTEALHIESLAEHIAQHIVGRQSALRAEARITARWPVRRTTPVSKLSTQEMVSLVGIAAATADGVRRVVGVEATGINACPCAQGLIRGRAAERLAEAGYEDVDRILDLVPARDAQPARQGIALRRDRAPAGRQRPRHDRPGVDERADLRAAEAARRAVRRRARPLAAALRRGLRAALAQGRSRRDARAHRRRLPLRASDQLRDDPRPRRPRRARGDSRGAARGARVRHAAGAAHLARGLAPSSRQTTRAGAGIGSRFPPAGGRCSPCAAGGRRLPRSR